MRLFVAVEIPEAVREPVAASVAGLRAAAPDLRWVAPQRYHLTLVFLGAVEDRAVPAVLAAVEEGVAAADLGPFDVSLSGEIGTFGRRVLWAGLVTSPALSALASSLSRSLSSVVALPDADRSFSAHLTLARAGRRPARMPALSSAVVPALAWSVERVVVMQSASGYEVIGAVDLRGRNA